MKLEMDMNVFLLCLSIPLLGYGIPMIFLKNVAWKIQEFENSAAGRKSKRTSSWDFHSTIRGVIMIIFAIALIISAFVYEF